MHSILIILKKPGLDESESAKRWRAAIETIATVLRTTLPEQELAEGVFLIRGSSDLPALGAVLAAAQRSGLSYRAIFIEQATEWSHDPNVKPKA